ncbi:universal stress protein [Acanthopleuribacter pedis]|uniref:Universal stress protein n=1 Tax=Acanthopleuribacter pedis TaxID=442870 RepID=A0A8J7QEZ7_9BACT|nr:universal stress protein [Acanthopleuribacter pedis]MBO1322789.1 universal stress protein [Acanthopleuribacter pedis]
MSSIKQVLCPVDFSEAGEAAISEAFACAHRQDAVLHLLHVDVLYDHDPYGAKHLQPEDLEISERTNTYYDEIIARFGSRGINIVRAEVRAIAAATGICTYAEEHKIDLIVTGSHGRRGVKHWLLGSVTEETIRNTPCPVLTVRAQRPEHRRGLYQRILVPTDLSEVADRTVRYARQAAANADGELLVLHVVNRAPIHDVYGWPQSSEWLQQALSTSEARLKRLTAEKGPTVKSQIKVAMGTPHQEIAAWAKEAEADIILMPHHSNNQIVDYFIGSTTERVLRETACPIFTIPVDRLHY